MNATTDKRNDLYNAVCDELTNRGVDYRKPDVFGFVAGCWPTESTAEEVADDFVDTSDGNVPIRNDIQGRFPWSPGGRS